MAPQQSTNHVDHIGLKTCRRGCVKNSKGMTFLIESDAEQAALDWQTAHGPYIALD